MLCLDRTPADPTPQYGLGGHSTGAEGVGETGGQSPGVRPADLRINVGSKRREDFVELSCWQGGDQLVGGRHQGLRLGLPFLSPSWVLDHGNRC